jgi:hypothetical protein
MFWLGSSNNIPGSLGAQKQEFPTSIEAVSLMQVSTYKSLEVVDQYLNYTSILQAYSRPSIYTFLILLPRG